jgi:hypothetical protein
VRGPLEPIALLHPGQVEHDLVVHDTRIRPPRAAEPLKTLRSNASRVLAPSISAGSGLHG